MKEIKFRLRIKDKIVGYEKWYGGNFGEITSAKSCWLYSKDGKYWKPKYIYHTRKDEYIGFKDKKKKEIYENDILAFKEEYWDNEKDCSGWKQIRIAVFWCYDTYKGYYDIKGEKLWDNGYSYEDYSEDIDWEETILIGNIFENPELLK